MAKELKTLGLVTNSDSFVTKAIDYVVLDLDGYHNIKADASSGPITITLPTAVDNANRALSIIKIDATSNQVIVDGEGSETISGDLTQILTVQYTSISIKCDGTEWFITS